MRESFRQEKTQKCLSVLDVVMLRHTGHPSLDFAVERKGWKKRGDDVVESPDEVSEWLSRPHSECS